MKGFVRLMAVVVTAAAFAVACSKDKDSGKITLDSPAVFFAQAGGSATVGFTAQNIKTLSATSKPTGWDEAVVDLAGATISVKAPSAEDIESGDAVKTGSFSFTGYTPGGTLVSATLFAGIVTTKDISAEVANSYIVSGTRNELPDRRHAQGRRFPAGYFLCGRRMADRIGIRAVCRLRGRQGVVLHRCRQRRRHLDQAGQRRDRGL